MPSRTLTDELLIPIEPLSQVSGRYNALAWLNEALILAHMPGQRPSLLSSRLVRLSLKDGTIEPYEVPDYPGYKGRCSFQLPSRLPDGRLSYVVRCVPNKITDPDLVYLMACDIDTPFNSTLLHLKPMPTAGLGVGQYAWNPDMSRGIAVQGNPISAQLYWFTYDRVEQLNIGIPQILAVSWAPNGQQIAFIGAPEQGLVGKERLEAVAHLYVMDKDGQSQRVLVPDLRLRNAVGIAWSPDSRWLIVSASVGPSTVRNAGLWLVEAATGKCWLIARGHFAAPVWSPDGQHIGTLKYDDTTYLTSHYTTYPIRLDVNVLFNQLGEITPNPPSTYPLPR